jgi:hypothetical protein
MHAAHIVFLFSIRRLLVTANIVPGSQLLVTLMMEALLSSETSVLPKNRRRNIPEEGIQHMLSFLCIYFHNINTKQDFSSLLAYYQYSEISNFPILTEQ